MNEGKYERHCNQANPPESRTHTGSEPKPEPVKCEECGQPRKWKWLPEGTVLAKIDGSVEEIEKFRWIVAACPHCTVLRREMKNARVPVRFLKEELSEFEFYGTDQEIERQEIVLGKIKTFIEAYVGKWKSGISAILLGSHGTGKTRLACKIIRDVLSKATMNRIKQGDDLKMFSPGKQIRFTTFAAMLREIRDTYWSGGKAQGVTASDVIERFKRYDLLIIDEIDVSTGGRDEYTVLFEILNSRYEDERSTVLISNLSYGALQDEFSPRIIERLIEGSSGILEFTWQSYRTYKKSSDKNRENNDNGARNATQMKVVS